MKVLRFTWRVMLLLPWLLVGLLLMALLYPLFTRGRGQRIVRGWSRGLLRCCGVRSEVIGQPRLSGAVLWVSNHVSWVDIFVINSVRASIFVAKSEVQRWPLIGWLAAGVGTLFINRSYRQAVRDTAYAVAQHFRQDRSVGLFPEGTTTDGMRVLPFRSGLFAPALDAGVPVQPVALQFFLNGVRSSHAAFIGNQSLLENLWCVLSVPGMHVRIEFLPVLEVDTGADVGVQRSQVAVMAEQAVRAAVVL